MQTKKWVASLFALLLLFSMLCIPANAEDEPEFRFELSIDGQDVAEVNTGDVITVTLYLYRTDKNEPYSMYAMQSEIRYDSEFFELVEDSELLSSGIHSTDIDVGGGYREFYMNYVSFSGGAEWQPKTRIGSFQLRVIDTAGVSVITNEDFLVSHRDGMGHYACDSNALTVILSTECDVKFETNGGTKIDPVTAIFGEKLTRPADPVREGMHLVGWYKDIFLTQEWNFDTDTVQGNMKLYAKWEVDEPPTTEPPTTEPPTTEPPTTEPPTTEPPTTEPPTTEPPTTEPPTTEPPTTEPDSGSETEPPTTETETETEIMTDPGKPQRPSNKNMCTVCGDHHAIGLGMCLRCSLIVYGLILLFAVLILALSILLYRLISKKLKANPDGQDDVTTQQSSAEDEHTDK